MQIARFEDIEGWQLARQLMNLVYDVALVGKFAKDFGLRDQITRAAGSVMHNIAEGFDAGSNVEFVRFLRFAQRSCTEIKSQLYVALDRKYIDTNQFNVIYAHTQRTHAKIGGFIRYLTTTPRPTTASKPTPSRPAARNKNS